jgi:cell wall-associated NlpC family hydrolase
MTFLLALYLPIIFLSDSAGYIPSGTDIEEYAMEYLPGCKYAEKGKTFDCSGYTCDVFKHFNILLPHSSKDIFHYVVPTEKDSLCKGDLVFFITRKKDISHVGIYLGNNKFIHMPGRNRYVRIDSLEQEYWKKCYTGGGRIDLNQRQQKIIEQSDF